MAKIVPSERLRRELDEVLAGVAECDDPVEAVARLGARLIMQQALEDEVTEFLGREELVRRTRDGPLPSAPPCQAAHPPEHSVSSLDRHRLCQVARLVDV